MDYKELDVWKKSIEFVESIYKATAKFPDEERFGLTNQLRRAAISIPSNIAEGSARQSDREFIRFLFIAYGSSAEIETQLIIAKNLGFIENIDILASDLLSIRKLIKGTINYLKNK